MENFNDDGNYMNSITELSDKLNDTLANIISSKNIDTHEVLMALAQLSAKYIQKFIREKELEDVSDGVMREFIGKFQLFCAYESSKRSNDSDAN